MGKNKKKIDTNQLSIVKVIIESKKIIFFFIYYYCFGFEVAENGEKFFFLGVN
jgi:hypothetical protein